MFDSLVCLSCGSASIDCFTQSGSGGRVVTAAKGLAPSTYDLRIYASYDGTEVIEKCLDSIDISFAVDTTPIITIPPSSVCEGDSIYLEKLFISNPAYSSITFKILGSGIIIQSKVLIIRDTTFDVSVVTADGCIDSSTINIIRISKPYAKNENVSICFGEDIKLDSEDSLDPSQNLTFYDLKQSNPAVQEYTRNTNTYYCDALSKYNVLHIDDILIKKCKGTSNDGHTSDDTDDSHDEISECNGAELNKEGFESNLGIWNDGGSDCYRLNNYQVASEGKYSLRLRDNSSGSKLISDILDLSKSDGIQVSFDFISNGFDGSEEDFMIEVSKDGGNTFTTVHTLAHGIDFENDKRYSKELSVSKEYLSSQSVIQIRCDASSNSDVVFLDNLTLKSCGEISALLEEVFAQSRSNEIEDLNIGSDSYDFELSPNPAHLFTRLDLEEVNGKTIKIELYNSLGGFVKSIPMDRVSERFLSLDLEGFPGGVYIVRMQVDDSYIIKKLTIGK